MHDGTSTIEAFLAATVAKQPTPGGGAVTALAGALAAAIGEMVLSYSVGKKDLADRQPELVDIATGLAHVRSEMLVLMAADQTAFVEMSAAKKLPADDAGRAEKIQATVRRCIEVPIAITLHALKVLALCDRATPVVNRFLLSDLAVSAELAMATVRAAGYSVRVNLPSLDSTVEKNQAVEILDTTSATAVGYIRRVIPAIWARVDSN